MSRRQPAAVAPCASWSARAGQRRSPRLTPPPLRRSRPCHARSGASAVVSAALVVAVVAVVSAAALAASAVDAAALVVPDAAALVVPDAAALVVPDVAALGVARAPVGRAANGDGAR